MARSVATSAGSSGGSQHPHNHPRCLPAQCEAGPDVPEVDEEDDNVDPPTKGRGVAIGEKIIRLRNQLGHAIPLEWDNTNRTRKAVGANGALYYTGVGIYVRNYCEAWHEKFADVPQSNIKKVIADVEYHFQPVDRDIVVQDAASRYRNWKTKINARIKRLGSRAETSGKGDHCKFPMEWLECVKRFRTDAFQEISKRNTNSRKKVRYASLQGRTPQAQRRHESTANGTKPSDTDFEVFKKIHMNKDGEWISPLAAEDHRKAS